MDVCVCDGICSYNVFLNYLTVYSTVKILLVSNCTIQIYYCFIIIITFVVVAITLTAIIFSKPLDTDCSVNPWIQTVARQTKEGCGEAQFNK